MVADLKLDLRAGMGRGAGYKFDTTSRSVIHGVSVRVVGSRLGLKISKPDDKHGNANGEFAINHNPAVSFG